MAAAGTVEFVLKARDEATRELQRVSGALGGMAEKVGKITATMGGIGVVATSIAAVGAGALTAAKGFADFAETLDRQAKTAGTSAANMQALKLAFENAGLSGEDASKSIAFLTDAIGRDEPLLKKLNITAKDSYNAFLQLGAAFDRSHDAGMKAHAATTLLGKSMKENAGIIGEVAQATVANQGVLQAYGAQMDDVAMRGALNLDKKLDDLNTRMQASKTTLGIHLTPAFVGLLDTLNGVLDALGRLPVALDSVGASADKFNATNKPMTPAERSIALAKAFQEQFKGQTMAAAHGENYGPDHNRPDLRGKFGGQGIGLGQALPDYGTEGAQLGLRGDLFGKDSAEKMAKHLEAYSRAQDGVRVSLLATLDPLTKVGKSFEQMQQQIGFSIGMAVDAVFYGAASIADAFKNLMRDILATVASSLAKLGIGLGLQALGMVSGQGWLVGVGGSVAGSYSMAPAGGGDTYVISTISSRDFVQQMASPNGEMRRASARVRDVSRAGR